jgi:cytoskeletal protein CcmA (bactofilin family)
MGEAKLPNLTISGLANTGGGKFHEVKVSGQGKLSSDVDCEHFAVSGKLEAGANVMARHLSISGQATIKGDVKVGKARISGQFTVGGQAQFEEVRVNGKTKVDGHVRCDEMDLHGSLYVKEYVEAEKFDGEGSFEIGGMLNAGKLRMLMHDSCKAKEIGGETIEVRRKGGVSALNQLVKVWHDPKLTVESIEGDEIVLECTVAGVVRGNRVKIGSGCEIGLVEYRERLDVDPAAKVKRQVQV